MPWRRRLTPCVENRGWTIGGVTYATLNVQGSCNNLCDTAPDPAEFNARNQANIVWLQETFDEAKDRRSSAIMLIAQANPGWDLSDGTRAPLRDPKTLAQTDGQPDGFVDYLKALRDQDRLRKPVSTPATRTTSASTSRFSMLRAPAGELHASRRSATTSRTATTTSTG